MQLNFIQRLMQDRYKNTNRQPNADELQRWAELDEINIYEPLPIKLVGAGHHSKDKEEEQLAMKAKISNAVITFTYNRGKSWSNRAKALGLTTKPIRDRFMKEKPSLDWLKDDDTALTRIEVSHYWGVSKWRSLPRYWLFEGDKKLNRQYVLLSDIRKQENNIKKEFLKQTKKGEEMAKNATKEQKTPLANLMLQKIAIDSLLKCHEDYISLNDFNERVIAFLERAEATAYRWDTANFGVFFKGTAELMKEAKTQDKCESLLFDLYAFINSDFPDFQDLVMSTLIKKGKEYSENENRISNFVNGAEAEGLTKKQYLFALARKHVQYLADTSVKEKDYKYEEHALDTFNYMLIYTVCFDKFAS